MAAAESKEINRQKPCSNIRHTVDVSEFGFYWKGFAFECAVKIV
jgi:hypothetical protein